jgi:hypothetical protein
MVPGRVSPILTTPLKRRSQRSKRDSPSLVTESFQFIHLPVDFDAFIKRSGPTQKHLRIREGSKLQLHAYRRNAARGEAMDKLLQCL